MDHQVLVGGLDGDGDLAQQFDPLLQVEPVLVAVVIDGHPLDELHRQVGHTLLGGAAVDQPGDVGMVQAGEDASLGVETFDQIPACQVAADQFQGDPLGESLTPALRPVDGAHAPLADLLLNGVRADLRAVFGVAADGQAAFGICGAEHLGGVVDRQQDRVDGRAQSGVAAAGAVQVGVALRLGYLEGTVADLEHSLELGVVGHPKNSTGFGPSGRGISPRISRPAARI